MPELPSGTVTLLFSDMEGSTRMLHRLGSAYVEALEGQREVLRGAWARHGGHELGTEGDSFYVVFATADAAVAAAVEGQREIGAREWPGEERVAVRIGMHTGAPSVHGDAYVGMDVHRAARVAAAAHGGQVLVSAATARLIEDSRGVGVVDLGEHLLKDIPRPERLFQVAAEGLETDFPPVRTLGSTSSLPYAGMPLVGREGELAELTGILGSVGSRLVTLTGPGGTGKTRLAVAAAREAAGVGDAVHFVQLETATTSEAMWAAIAGALDVPAEHRNPPELFDHIAHTHALLVLDNLEQIPTAGDVVAQLLGAASTVRVLATSRTPLHVRGEHEHSVPPLELPATDTLDAAEASGSVQMFVRQAALVRRGFVLTEDNHAAVSAICTRLDGLPLALELAAARLKMLSPQALLKRLDTALDLVSSDGRRPGRQQTLRQAIEWSYSLLDSDQQRLLALLSLFPGGATFETLETVIATLDWPLDAYVVAEQLVDASLVTTTEASDGETRLTMLNTIRTFATEQLHASPERDGVHRAAIGWAFDLVDSPDREGDGPAYTRYAAEMATELVNMTRLTQLAMDRADATDHTDADVATATRIVRRMVGWSDDGMVAKKWAEQAVAQTQASSISRVVRAEALVAHGHALMLTGNRHEALANVKEALSLAEGHGITDFQAERLRMDALDLRGLIYLESNELHRARQDTQVALADARLGMNRRLTNMLRLGIIESAEGNPGLALSIEEEVVRLAERSGFRMAMAAAHHNVACSLRELGRPDEAERRMRGNFVALSENGDLDIICFAEDYAAVLIDLGRFAEAATMLGAAEALRGRVHMPRSPYEEQEQRSSLERARVALGVDWDERLKAGRNLSVEEALAAIAGTD